MIEKENLGYKKSFSKKENLGLVSSIELGKLPPQALDLEESVLGALMLEKEALTNIIDILKPENFYKDAHKEIYQSIIDLFNDSQPIDLLTVTNQLKKNGTLDIVGGSYYVTKLTTRVNSASNIEFHSRIILEQSIKRELINISSKVQKDAYEDTIDVFDLLDQTEQSLFDVSESHIRKNYKKVQNLMKEAIDELETKKEKKDGITGVPSGFIDLDTITSGWQPSDLVIIAGSRLKIPLSTTHCQVGATVGVGLLENTKSCSGINCKIFLKTAIGWLITCLIVGLTTAMFISPGVFGPSIYKESCPITNSTI